MRLACCWLISLALLSCRTTDTADQQRLEQAWVQQVLLGTEAGDARDAVVRWSQPVHYLVVAAPPRVERAANAAFAQIQRVLERLHSLALEHVDEQDPRIGNDGYVTIFARAPRLAAALAAQHGAQAPDPYADGWFTIVWNARFDLLRAIVFVDPALPDPWLNHTVLEEMFQALGPANDCALMRDSLLFESATLPGSHQQLARVDVQVLRLLYGELRPGDQARDIAQAMGRVWSLGDS